MAIYHLITILIVVLITGLSNNDGSLLCARFCPKPLTGINSWILAAFEANTIIIPTLEMRKLVSKKGKNVTFQSISERQVPWKNELTRFPPGLETRPC